MSFPDYSKPDYSKFKILTGNNWDVFLYPNQTCLGRIYFWYKEKTIEGKNRSLNSYDLLDISSQAFLEFYTLGGKIKTAINKVFAPDMFNYISLNNRTKHLHIHIVPRYSRPVPLFGYTFKDETFGSLCVQKPEFNLGNTLLVKIAQKIKKAFPVL